MNSRSLRFQLGVWYAGLLTGLLILLGLATIVVLKHYLEGSVRESQLRRAHQIAQILTPEILKGGAAAVADEVEARFAPELNSRFVRIQGADRAVIYRSGIPQDKSFDPDAVPSSVWPSRSESSEKVMLPDGITLLIASYLVRAPGQGAWLVQSGAPLTGTQTVLRDAALALMGTLVVAIAVAAAGGYFLVGRALTVVDQISRSAEEISFQNLSDRLPVARTGDEIERLSLALNRMIERLDHAFQHSKRFVADASHELRTPLAILRGELESLLTGEELTVAAKERLGSLLEEVDRLAKVVEGLLMLSRLDAGEAQGEWVSLDLSELTRSTAEQMGLLAEDRNIQIQCLTPTAVLVQGDRTRLKQVIVNLLDNAVKYTPEGGQVALQVSKQAGWAVLEVADTGIGIPAEGLPHVFERFFRADQARSRDVGGAGLGLAIVQSICVAHGGLATVESVVGQGSRFRVKLPLASETGPAIHRGERPAQGTQSHDNNPEKQMARVA